MKTDKRKKKSIFLRIALLAFSVYVIVMLVQLQMELSAAKQNVDNLDQAIQNKQMMVEELENQKENYEDYLDQQAREQGYARPGETIYKEIPGS